MRFKNIVSLFALCLCTCVCAKGYPTPVHYIQTSETQAQITPLTAIKKLQAGNQRFLDNKMRHRDYALQTKTTAQEGQAPFAVILSCMDSRGSPDILFDQGIGDIFSLRVAGNILNKDISGSLEYATVVVGAKLILVMGHSKCGAVEASCKGIKLGNITSLLSKITPAVQKIKDSHALICNKETVDRIAKQNVLNVMRAIPQESILIRNLKAEQKIAIVGAFHDLSTGKISMFDDSGKDITP